MPTSRARLAAPLDHQVKLVVPLGAPQLFLLTFRGLSTGPATTTTQNNDLQPTTEGAHDGGAHDGGAPRRRGPRRRGPTTEGAHDAAEPLHVAQVHLMHALSLSLCTGGRGHLAMVTDGQRGEERSRTRQGRELEEKSKPQLFSVMF
ncbi:unnamed protein product [Arctogadus glacialis]